MYADDPTSPACPPDHHHPLARLPPNARRALARAFVVIAMRMYVVRPGMLAYSTYAMLSYKSVHNDVRQQKMFKRCTLDVQKMLEKIKMFKEELRCTPFLYALARRAARSASSHVPTVVTAHAQDAMQ